MLNNYNFDYLIKIFISVCQSQNINKKVKTNMSNKKIETNMCPWKRRSPVLLS